VREERRKERRKKEEERGRRKRKVAGVCMAARPFRPCGGRKAQSAWPGPSALLSASPGPNALLSASPGPNACPGGPTAPSLTRQPPFGLAVADWALFGQAGAN